MALPTRTVNGLPVTDFSSLDRKLVFAVDNNERPFIVDTESGIRYATGGPGTGSYRAAFALFGPPEAGVFLSGMQERNAVGDLFQPNEMEQIIAGRARVPASLRGSVAVDDQGFFATPQSITTGSGETVTVAPARAPEAGQSSVEPQAQDAHEYLAGLLRDYGLDSLADDLWGWITEGVDTQPELVQRIRETPEFAQRFPAIKAREDAGLPPISPAQYVQYEQQLGAIFEQTGLSPFMEKDDVDRMLARNVNAVSVAQRVGEAFSRATQQSPEVLGAFEDLFGVHGRAALAAYWLDKDGALGRLGAGLERIEREVSTAEVAGAGRMLGFDIGREQATRLSEFGFDFGSSQEGFRRASQMRPLSVETISERDDLTEEDIVEAGFQTDLETLDKLERRRRSRLAAFEGGGGAATTQRGVVGLGTAE